MSTLTADAAAKLYKKYNDDTATTNDLFIADCIKKLDNEIKKGISSGKPTASLCFIINKLKPLDISKLKIYYTNLGYVCSVTPINPNGPTYQIQNISITFEHLL